MLMLRDVFVMSRAPKYTSARKSGGGGGGGAKRSESGGEGGREEPDANKKQKNMRLAPPHPLPSTLVFFFCSAPLPPALWPFGLLPS